MGKKRGKGWGRRGERGGGERMEVIGERGRFLNEIDSFESVIYWFDRTNKTALL